MNARTVASVVGAVSVAMPVVAAAAQPVRLASDVFVERFVQGPGGRISRVLERADRLRSGDRVIFVVNWQARQAREFTVTNPMPRAIAFQRSSDGGEEVSIDGGRSWGALVDLRVHEADGQTRYATPEDVTHVRWRVPPRLALLGAGQLTYRGVVR